MADDRVTLLHEWFEHVWNRGDLTAIDRLMSPDVVIHGLQDADGNPLQGKQGFIPAVMGGHDLEGPGAPREPVSELPPAERARLIHTQPIATDDLLDLHLFLDEFDGNFAALFGKGGARE